jgi:hypothetical protein
VRAYPVVADGAGYKATITNLLSSTDTWFRPSDVCVGPDGSVYVADWNDPGVGGHNMGDNKLESMRGRVYRLAPPGHLPSVPPLDLNTVQGCGKALESPNLATRYLAWTKLHEMKEEAEPVLLSLWHGNNQRWRARALFLLARIPGKGEQYVNAGMADGNSDIRITALRIARELKLDMAGLVARVVHDPSPQVRRECAIDLRHNHSPEAPKLWAELARQYQPGDRWYLEALGIGANEQWDRYLSAWLESVGDQWDTPAGRDIVWRSRSEKTPDLIVKIIKGHQWSQKERDHYLRSLDFIQGPEKQAALLDLLN